MAADLTPDTNTRKRTEDAAEDRAKHGNKSSFAQVDHVPMCLTSFGDDSTEPPTLPLRDDALVNKGAVAPKPCRSLVEMRTLTTAGGLLPAGTASMATRTIFHQPSLWNFCPTDEMNLRTTSNPIRHVQQFLKSLRNKNKASLGVRSWRLYRSSTRLHVSDKVALVALWGAVRLDAAVVSHVGAILVGGRFVHHFLTAKRSVMPYVLRWIVASPKPGWFEG